MGHAGRVPAAILVSLVKLRELATVIPGPGLFAFSTVVVLTFDPTLIWTDRGDRV